MGGTGDLLFIGSLIVMFAAWFVLEKLIRFLEDIFEKPEAKEAEESKEEAKPHDNPTTPK